MIKYQVSRRRCYWFLWFLFAFLLTGYVTATASLGRDVLRIGIPTFPCSLNPVYATTESSQAIINKVFDSLFAYNARGQIVEGLAKHVRLAIGPKTSTLTLDLNENARFSDGHALEPDDVIQTVKLLKNPAFKYPYFSSIRYLTGIEKKGPHGLKITIQSQPGFWKNYLRFKILNGREIKGISAETFKTVRLSGTGPYRFKTVAEPAQVVLELNPFADQGTSSGRSMYRFIEYTVIADTRLTPLKLLNNEIDICELQPENIGVYERTPLWKQRFHIRKYKKLGYTFLVFNLRRAAMDQNVRNLFYNIVQGGDFLDHFLKNKGERVRSPFLQLKEGVITHPLKTTPLSQEVHLKILTNTESKLRRELVLFLKQEMKPYKIMLEPIFLEYHTFLQTLKTGDCDLAISGYIVDLDFDMREIFGSGSYFNYARFQNREMDTLLETLTMIVDPVKRNRIYGEAHQLWLKHLPFIPLFNLDYYIGVSTKVDIPIETCRIVGAEGDFLFNIKDWKVSRQ